MRVTEQLSEVRWNRTDTDAPHTYELDDAHPVAVLLRDNTEVIVKNGNFVSVIVEAS